MRFAAALLCVLLLPLPGAAQHWMTRERCTVTDIRIDPDVLAPGTLQRLRATAATVPNGVGKYWRITAPGGAVSYLWGTWHSNDPLMLDLPARVIAQVRAARVAAFEIDPVLPTRRAVENAVSPRDRWVSRGGTLAAMDLPPDIERWINARLIGLGWGDDSADFMMPGALVELLSGDPCNDFAMGTYPNQDSYLQTIAAISGAQIMALEELTALRQKLNQRQYRALASDVLMLYGSTLSPDG
ncbi:MAG: TraB/GumN family protein, partial [Pseudomonadota bacterium]